MGLFFNMKAIKKQAGFTLVEVFFALVLGLALLTGVLSVFLGMKTTSSETTSYGVMQENGRFALALLTDDLLRQNFWGDLTGVLDKVAVPISPNPVLAGDCQGGGVNNGSFPWPDGHFRTLWGTTAVSANTMCMTDAKIGSDVLQLKRAVAFPYLPPPAPAPNTDNLEDNRYYIHSNANSAAIFNGTEDVPEINNGRVWEYQHHIYYVSEEGSTGIPVLNRGRLMFGAGGPIAFDMVVEGIEQLYFMYGVDTDNDGIVNTHLSATNMTETYWDNGDNTSILTVTVYVLVRDILPDNKYENNNVYQIGDTSFDADGDNFRRLLMSSTVVLNNARSDEW